ncbi:MAG: GNAT family N-acetyltransferase [Planctomycetota bacterium JB042]
MALQWIREDPPRWDDAKARLIGDAPAGVFDRRYGACAEGERLPGEWWRVEKDGETVGFGWLDIVWGDAEILLVSDPAARGEGVGTFILEHLEDEARSRGVNYVYNAVRPTHPERREVTAWLRERGFEGADDGSLLRAVARKRERA